MYTHKQKNKAIQTLITFNMQYTKTIRKLGYPTSRASLRNWYKEYLKYGTFNDKKSVRRSKYSEADKEVAVSHYFKTGENISNTVKDLGYPCRATLRSWIIEHNPITYKTCNYSHNEVRYSHNDKLEAVTDLLERTTTVEVIASKYGVSRLTLYNWKAKIVGTEVLPKMKNKVDESSEINDLCIKVNELQKEVYRLQLEKDVLEMAAEIIKKDPGISPQNLSNKEKTIMIDALMTKYKLIELLTILEISKSSYYYQKRALLLPSKYLSVTTLIKDIFKESMKTYGYRRIDVELKKKGVFISDKVIRKIMRSEKLNVIFIKRKKYNSYLGEISPAVDNIIKRDFHADKPNLKWLTDITEFHIPAGKIYLSPIIDCFDGLVCSWTIGTSPDAQLVNNMLNTAITTLKDNEYPLIHSDRGSHYRWPEWIAILAKRNITRSMSKKGCSPDNSACEGFFGRLKNEMFYGRDWNNVSLNEFINILNEYINWYNGKRVKLSLGGLSPIEYRTHLGLL